MDERNSIDSRLLLFSNDEDVLGQVRDARQGRKSEWRNVPPFNRLLAHGGWDVGEVNVTRVVATGYKNVFPIHSRIPAPGFVSQGHLANAPCEIHCIGPLVYIFLVQLQPCRKGSEGCPSDQRRTVHVDTEVSVNRESGPGIVGTTEKSTQNRTMEATSPSTASILTISWPGKHRSICSRILVGSPVRRSIVPASAA